METSLFLFVYKNIVIKQIILHYISYIHNIKNIKVLTWKEYSLNIKNLVYHGYTDLFTKALKNHTNKEIIRMKLGDIAAKRGHIDILKKLINMNVLRGDEVNLTVMSGKFEVFKSFATMGNQKVTTMAMDITSKIGDFEMLKWMHYNRTEGCSTNAIDFAAINNHMEIVQWLFNNRTEGCSHTSFDWAARNGNFKMIDLLLANNKTQKTFTTKAIDLAAQNNQLPMVRYLTENFPTLKCTTDAYDYACGTGNLELVLYLHENRTEGGTNICIWYSATNGHLEVTRFLYENTKFHLPNITLRECIINGHIEVSNYLIDMNRPHLLEGSEVGYAAKLGNYEIVHKLLSFGLYFDAEHAMKLALEKGHLDIVIKLQNHYLVNYNLFKPFNMSGLVMKSNNLTSIRWYIEKHPEKIEEIKSFTTKNNFINWNSKIEILDYIYKLNLNLLKSNNILLLCVTAPNLPALKHFHEVIGLPISDSCLDFVQNSSLARQYIKLYIKQCLDKNEQEQQQQQTDKSTTTSPTSTTSSSTSTKQHLSRRQLKKNRNKD